MRYLAKISYDGSNFYGFQRLNEERSVQKVIEDALTIVNKSVVEVKGAGRTDKGVHAYGQRVHFDLDITIPADNLKRALNDILPDDVRIEEIKDVSDDFHARFNVIKKIYQYKINIGKYDPLKSKYYYQIDCSLDYDLLEQCKNELIGVHNFHNFVSGERDNYDAIIYDIDIKKEDDIITITFIGKSFYRYMVRNMVGAMLDVSTGKKTIADLKEMFSDNKDIQMSCAPASVLYLIDIYYE